MKRIDTERCIALVRDELLVLRARIELLKLKAGKLKRIAQLQREKDEKPYR